MTRSACPARRPWRSIGLLITLALVSAALGWSAASQAGTAEMPEPPPVVSGDAG